MTIEPLFNQLKGFILKHYTIFGYTFKTLNKLSATRHSLNPLGAVSQMHESL